MQLQRQNYALYLLGLAPWLILGAIAEVWICSLYFDSRLVWELFYFLLCGIALLFASFWMYTKIHTVTLRPNYIHVRTKFLPFEREVLLSDVKQIEIVKHKKEFGHATLRLKSGEVFKISHLDSPELIEIALERKLR